MYRKPHIKATVKVRRLEWAGHLLRMCDDSIVKKVFLGKPDGRRKARGPKLRWFNCVESDLKSRGIKRWQKKSKDGSV
jgi:hypothetical protein